MKEFEGMLDKYTVFCILVIVASSVGAVALSIFEGMQGNFFTIP